MKESGAKEKTIYLFESDITGLKEASKRSRLDVDQLIALAIANFLQLEQQEMEQTGISYSQKIAILRQREEAGLYRNMMPDHLIGSEGTTQPCPEKSNHAMWTCPHCGIKILVNMDNLPTDRIINCPACKAEVTEK